MHIFADGKWKRNLEGFLRLRKIIAIKLTEL